MAESGQEVQGLSKFDEPRNMNVEDESSKPAAFRRAATYSASAPNSPVSASPPNFAGPAPALSGAAFRRPLSGRAGAADIKNSYLPSLASIQRRIKHFRRKLGISPVSQRGLFKITFTVLSLICIKLLLFDTNVSLFIARVSRVHHA